jgi:hypothetical protein
MSRISCPCCNYLTFDSEEFPGSYHICPVCFWEDDPIQFRDPEYSGGANKVSLNEAKVNYKLYGACEESMKIHCRPPFPEEIPKQSH